MAKHGDDSHACFLRIAHLLVKLDAPVLFFWFFGGICEYTLDFVNIL